jgi:hypothetical protein
MKMPGFTAEAAFYRSNVHYSMEGTLVRANYSRVIPARRFVQVEVKCAPGDTRICEWWCDRVGGGLVENPDGTVSCWVVV